MSLRLALVSVLVLVRASTSVAQDVPEPWTVDDVVMQESYGSWSLTRDGARALWVRSKPDEKKDAAVATLMLTELASGESRALTVGQDGVASPAFSPDGTRIAFLSSRSFPDGEKGPAEDEKGAQVWVLELAGGEARPLTGIPFGVGSFQWAEDGRALWLTTRERPTRAEARDRKGKDDTIVVEDPQQFFARGRRLFRFDIEEKKLARAGADAGPVEAFAVSPDGRHAVVRHGRSPSAEAENAGPPALLVHDLETGTTRELFADRKSKATAFAWRYDSGGFYVLVPRSTVDGETSAAISVVAEVALPDLAVTDVDLGHERGLASVFEVTPDGFIAGLADGVRIQLARYTRGDGGWRKDELVGEHAGRIHSLSAAHDASRVVYVTGSASDPDHVMTAPLAGAQLGAATEIGRPNGGFAKKPLAKTEVIRWTGALDEEVEGILYYPHDWTAGERRPLILITHGGPHGADADRFSERWANSPNLYAQRGAFVLKTNYHGSARYGLAFGESIKARYYELELVDMFAGIDHLVQAGKVDPDRMGLVGWSNGAILSIAALTLAHLYAPQYEWTFRVCAPGAGDVNWTSDYGNCAFGARFDDYYLGGPPWQIPDLYLRKSPLFHVERVTTPTIIFFGTDDTSVPTEQGWEWYRALHVVGQAPVRFLLFPGEPHGFRKLTHQKRKLTEELAWVDRYLFETESEDDALIQDGSPLDLATKRSGFARYGEAWGRASSDALVPETVRTGDVAYGRFEVTRAQWASFDPTAVDLLHPNHPKTGLGADDARRYVAWLREKTGEPWRLLTASELKGLPSGAEENTLDWWAGYSPSPREVAPLAARVAALGPDRALMPAGSRAPGKKRHGAQEVLIFDVGGNAAELVLDASGRVVARGASAVTSPDDRGEAAETPRPFVGLRVAVGPSPREEK